MHLRDTKPLLTILSRWLLVILWAGTIFLLSSHSDPYSLIPEKIFRWIYFTHIYGIRLTKIVGPLAHAFQFAILAFLLSRALHVGNEFGKKHVWIVVILCTAFALSDEIHQYFVPRRAFQWTDLLVDLLGIISGAAAYYFFSHRPGKVHGDFKALLPPKNDTVNDLIP